MLFGPCFVGFLNRAGYRLFFSLRFSFWGGRREKMNACLLWLVCVALALPSLFFSPSFLLPSWLLALLLWCGFLFPSYFEERRLYPSSSLSFLPPLQSFSSLSFFPFISCFSLPSQSSQFLVAILSYSIHASSSLQSPSLVFLSSFLFLFHLRPLSSSLL